MKKITLLIHCKDRPGIISAVTSFISSKKGNIVYIDQHVDSGEGIFFMRLECEFEIALDKLNFYDSFSLKIASQFQMQWELYTASYKPKMAIFVSKYDHCLHDLLGRFRSEELAVEIPFVVSNHLDLRPIVESFNIPFYHTAVDKNNKDVVAKKHLELLKGNAVDFVVLARYMQIIPKTLIDAYPNQIINIHHSFLPAFVGAKPYHSAFERGVKIIGATSHYVTEDLDAGPIIAQDVSHVSHTHSIKDLIAKGRDLEKIVLATAVQLHLKRKVMTYNNKTVIFS